MTLIFLILLCFAYIMFFLVIIFQLMEGGVTGPHGRRVVQAVVQVV